MTILDLLTGLARANLAAAAAIVVVMLLRKPARRAFGARAAYLMWIAPGLAGAAALVPPASTAAPLAPAMVMDAVVIAGGAVEAGVSAAPGAPAVLLALWIAGGLGAAVLLLRRQASFMAAIARREAGPAVVGALRPRIVTPADFETRFDAHEREVILAHEGAHISAGDARINALAALALCACWFNPLVHFAVHLMRLDQELACDAAVLGRFPGARRLYAEVLLKTQLATQPLPFGCHWPAAAEHPLKERIVMLKSPLPAPARRVAGIAVVAVLSAAGAAAAWAAQPGQPKPTAPVERLAAAPAPPVMAEAPRAAREPREARAARPAVPAREAVEAIRVADAAPPTPPPRVVMPDWVLRPDGADVVRFYPAAAAAAKQEGRATITCRVDGEGRLGACQLINEAPAGAGFGDAALALADRFQMKPVDRNGVATAGQDVRIPFKFALPAAS